MSDNCQQFLDLLSRIRRSKQLGLTEMVIPKFEISIECRSMFPKINDYESVFDILEDYTSYTFKFVDDDIR